MHHRWMTTDYETDWPTGNCGVVFAIEIGRIAHSQRLQRRQVEHAAIALHQLANMISGLIHLARHVRNHACIVRITVRM